MVGRWVEERDRKENWQGKRIVVKDEGATGKWKGGKRWTLG
jgi:hypothetical protein